MVLLVRMFRRPKKNWSRAVELLLVLFLGAQAAVYLAASCKRLVRLGVNNLGQEVCI